MAKPENDARISPSGICSTIAARTVRASSRSAAATPAWPASSHFHERSGPRGHGQQKLDLFPGQGQGLLAYRFRLFLRAHGQIEMGGKDTHVDNVSAKTN